MVIRSQIQFCVKPSPASNDFQVKIFVDAEDLISKYWPKMLGIDPAELDDFEQLRPQDVSHEFLIARCGCGVSGCGSVSAKMKQIKDYVLWDSWTGEPPAIGPLTFDKGQYLNEFNRLVLDNSWESPARTTDRLLKEFVAHEALNRHGLKYQWGSDLLREGKFTVSLLLSPGPFQILVHFPQSDLSPMEQAQSIAAALKKAPDVWNDVEWYNQSGNQDSAPSISGHGWRRA